MNKRNIKINTAKVKVESNLILQFRLQKYKNNKIVYFKYEKNTKYKSYQTVKTIQVGIIIIKMIS